MSICKQCNKEFKSLRKSAQFCSDSCRVRYARSKSVTISNVTDIQSKLKEVKKNQKENPRDKMTFDEYFGSKEYADDIRNLVQNLENKTTFGGVTKNGYTHFKLIDGTIVSIPVGNK